MIEAFTNQLITLTGEPTNKRFLLAVSGGVDSVVMTSLFMDAGLIYGIAHCNFQLRGKESEEDLKFVKSLAKANAVPCYSVHFNTMEYVKKNKVSVQMAARDLRYDWLEKTSNQRGYDFIVTAHHTDDAIETFFVNLLRGTGIAGLRGIPAISNNVVRPMLHFSKSDIEKYARQRNLEWRVDRSNDKDDYTRNRIRHHLIPVLDNVDTNARKGIVNTMEMIAEQVELYNTAVNLIGSNHIVENEQNVKINLNLIYKKHPVLVLFEYCKKYGFNYETCKLIVETTKKMNHSGKIFLSDTHKAYLDRGFLTITKIKHHNESNFSVTESTGKLDVGNYSCDFKGLTDKDFKLDSSKLIAYLDESKLSFPLKIRKWKAGDKFYPLGMSNPKKVSDFLIDAKVPLIEKEDIRVLVSGGKIAWVMGYRIDDRYKITEATKKIYLCTLTKHE